MFVKKLLVVMLITNCLFSSAIAIAAPATGAHWSYHGQHGPQHWGKLDKQYQLCAIGKAQSPINITATATTNQYPLQIHYVTTAIQVVNDSNTVLNINGKETIINDGHTLQMNLPKNSRQNFVNISHKSYYLIEFHFHTPSENLINNKKFPIEIHFVNQSDDGKLAVLGMMLTVGKYNRVLQTLFDELPRSKKAFKIATKLVVPIANLLPIDKTYYNFRGSLTTPPCSENVKWFVFATPVEASQLQINQLKTLLPADNARPVQALNGRAIVKSAEVK